MIYLDTSALIRFFTAGDKNKAEKVKSLLNSSEMINISDVVFPEIEYVLKGVYKAEREDITKVFLFLSSQRNIQVSKSIIKAVKMYEQTSLDMADCIIASASEEGKFASFDFSLLSQSGVDPYWK